MKLTVALSVALLAIGSAALWIRLSHASAMTMAFHRLLYATVVVAFPGGRALRRELPALGVRHRWAVVGAGLALAVHFTAWIASIAPRSPFATSTAASTTLVVTHPAMVLLAERVFFKTTLRAVHGVGIFLALSGAALIACSDLGAGHRLTGDFLALLGAGAGAVYFLLGSRVRAGLSLWAYVFPVYATATVGVLVAGVLTETPLVECSFREQMLFVVMALGPMVVGHTTLNWSLRWLPAWMVSAVILAEPPVSVALVYFVTGERPPVGFWPGGVLIFTGLVVLSRAAMEPEKTLKTVTLNKG